MTYVGDNQKQLCISHRHSKSTQHIRQTVSLNVTPQYWTAHNGK